MRAVKKRAKWPIVLALMILMVLAAGGLCAYSVYHFYHNIVPEVTVEAGEPVPDKDEFLVEPSEYMVCDTDLSAIDTSVSGEHIVEFSCWFLKTESKLLVKDTIPPVGELREITVRLGEKPEARDFVSSMEDVTNITARYAMEPDFSKTGTHMVTIILEDGGGNYTILKSNLTIFDPNDLPVIKGTEDISIYEGDTVSYRSGVTVTANMDPDPKLSIDNSEVNLDVAGVYPVTYTATDKFGRENSVSIKVKVSEKPENYGDMMHLYEMADNLLTEIISPEMSEIEKAFYIFRWVRLYVPWIRTGSHENEVEQATRGLEGNSGDCFTHAVACKVLLQRAGFLCTMIEKKNETGTHYWLLVFVDGNWYHMDPSPIYITQYVAFLATDAQLKEYANKWRPHLYDLDQNPYPATPINSPASVVYQNGEYYMTLLDQNGNPIN